MWPTYLKSSFAFFFNPGYKRSSIKNRVLADVRSSHVVYGHRSLMTNRELFITSMLYGKFGEQS